MRKVILVNIIWSESDSIYFQITKITGTVNGKTSIKIFRNYPVLKKKLNNSNSTSFRDPLFRGWILDFHIK